jgi:hypothetical protein
MYRLILIFSLFFQLNLSADICKCIPEEHKAGLNEGWVNAGQTFEKFGVYMQDSLLSHGFVDGLVQTGQKLEDKLIADGFYSGEAGSTIEMIGKLYANLFTSAVEVCWDKVGQPIVDKAENVAKTCGVFILEKSVPQWFWPKWARDHKANQEPSKSMREILEGKINNFIHYYNSLRSYQCYNKDGREQFIAATLNALYWKGIDAAMDLATAEASAYLKMAQGADKAAEVAKKGIEKILEKAKEIGEKGYKVYKFIDQKSAIVKLLTEQGYWKEGCLAADFQF